MVIVLKVLFSHGFSLSYILIHSVIFRNGPTNVSNSSKGVPVPYRVPPLSPRQGLGRDSAHGMRAMWCDICHLVHVSMRHMAHGTWIMEVGGIGK